MMAISRLRRETLGVIYVPMKRALSVGGCEETKRTCRIEVNRKPRRGEDDQEHNLVKLVRKCPAANCSWELLAFGRLKQAVLCFKNE